MKLPHYVMIGIDRLENNGFEAYVVGGAVRDELLGRRPIDYDLCTNATADEISTIFSDFTLVKPGARFGTVRVIIGVNALEITTYRLDGEYSDGRRPDRVRFCQDLRQDLSRRDFTINAMAYHPRTGFVDPFGGEGDLQARVVRCVGDPATRFREDALRILRALRISARLDFIIDAETELAARALKANLKQLSPERIRDELSGFIVCPNAGVHLMRHREMFFEIIPELAPCDGFLQQNPNHNFDVLGHIAETINRSAPDLVLRLAALLHDIGKPQCMAIYNGRGTFGGHMERSAEIAKVILTRLRYPAKIVETVCVLVLNHDKPYNRTPVSARRWLHQIGSKNVFLLIKLKMADCLAHDPSYHNRLHRIAGFKREVAAAIARGDCYALSRLAVNGGDINSALGLAPGSYTGEILNMLLNNVIEGEVRNGKSELIALAREYHQTKHENQSS